MKMIRDKYDEIISPDRLKVVTNYNEKLVLYSKKINEELDELIESNYNDIYEYADLIETIVAMAKLKGISFESIESARTEKRLEKGGFDKCLVLIK